MKAFDTYKDKNFTILGVSLDSEKMHERWIDAIKWDNLTSPQVSDLKGWKNEVAKLYVVRGDLYCILLRYYLMGYFSD